MFVVFAGLHYYPIGGWLDKKGAYVTKEAAIHAADTIVKSFEEDWAHVVDLSKGEMVYSYMDDSPEYL